MSGGGSARTGGSSVTRLSVGSVLHLVVLVALIKAKPTLYLKETAFHSKLVWLGKLIFVLMIRKKKRYSQPSDNLAQDSGQSPSAKSPPLAGTQPSAHLLVSFSPKIHRFVSACVSFPFLKNIK